MNAVYASPDATGSVRMGEKSVGYMILFSIDMIIGRMPQAASPLRVLSELRPTAAAVLQVDVGPEVGELIESADLGHEVAEEATEDAPLHGEPDGRVGLQVVRHRRSGVQHVRTLFDEHHRDPFFRDAVRAP